MIKSHYLAVIAAALNFGLLIAVLLTRGEGVRAQSPPGVLRGTGLELVDAAGRVRAQFNVEADGEAVFRLRDGTGAIRVKLAAGRDGSGLVLLDETTEVGVQMVARRVPSAGRRTTSIRLARQGGERVVEP
jgi:hypothetical protein